MNSLIPNFLQGVLGPHGLNLPHSSHTFPTERPLPEDGNVLECFPSPSSDGNDRSTSFHLPVSSDKIYFLSRGNYAFGSLRFIVDNGIQSDKIRVDITVTPPDPGMMKHFQACLLNRGNEYGVGFFSPSYIIHSSPSIKVDVNIRFPRPSAGAPLRIKNLSTEMTIWPHIINLGNLVTFDSVSLAASNAVIDINDVTVNSCRLTTNNAHVTGSFNVLKRLEITTSNAGINVKNRIENKDPHNPTKINLNTSNGAIAAVMSLVSQVTGSSAVFDITATTSNGPLTLSFPEAPRTPSVINLHGDTSNNVIDVTLHPTYEGSIALVTSNARSALNVRSDITDPSGQGRQHSVTHKQSTGTVLHADVKWGHSSPAGKGKVELTSSNSPVTCRL